MQIPVVQGVDIRSDLALSPQKILNVYRWVIISANTAIEPVLPGEPVVLDTVWATASASNSLSGIRGARSTATSSATASTTSGQENMLLGFYQGIGGSLTLTNSSITSSLMPNLGAIPGDIVPLLKEGFGFGRYSIGTNDSQVGIGAPLVMGGANGAGALGRGAALSGNLSYAMALQTSSESATNTLTRTALFGTSTGSITFAPGSSVIRMFVRGI
jgi:hypothetical protein